MVIIIFIGVFGVFVCRLMYFKIYWGEERYNVIEYFVKLSIFIVKRFRNVFLNKIDEDGFFYFGDYLEKGDIIIGKLIVEMGNFKFVDLS